MRSPREVGISAGVDPPTLAEEGGSRAQTIDLGLTLDGNDMNSRGDRQVGHARDEQVKRMMRLIRHWARLIVR